LIVIGLMMVAAVAANHRWAPAWLIAVAGSCVLVAIGWQGFSGSRILLDPVLASATLLSAAIIERFILVIELRRERGAVRDAFAHYMSPAMVEQLVRDPTLVRLGGERRHMTFLFCDVRGFTSISETFQDDPAGLTSLINRLLTPMTDAILAHNGTIDKYMGDCIMAFWNAPLDDPSHARNAMHAALAMIRSLDGVNASLADEAAVAGTAPIALRVGVGLNSGDCVVGNMGSEQRFDYSVLGDAVNLASRFEGQSKNYGVDIVIGEATLLAAPELASVELDLIAVKGKTEATRIYALLGDEERAKDADFQAFRADHAEMLAAYRAQDWDSASTRIDRLRALAPEFEALCDLYVGRIADYRADPPGADWDGVFIAESK
jgi:adenylate cyclase